MPGLTAPVGYCSTPGCPNRAKGQCPDHAKARRQDRQTGWARTNPLLHTQRWRRYSKARLARHPYCVGFPRGVHTIQTLAQCTDHRLPWRTHPDRFWDEANHDSLCLDCNKRKNIAEEGGFTR